MYAFFSNYNFVFLASLDELISHGLLALRECLPNDGELTSKVIILTHSLQHDMRLWLPQNVSIAVVGMDKPLEILDNDQVQPYVSQL